MLLNMAAAVVLGLATGTALETSSARSQATDFPTLAIGRDEGMLPFVELQVGRPAQRERLRLDITQPYLWLLSGRTYPECNRKGGECPPGGLYFPKASEAYRDGDEGVHNVTMADGVEIGGVVVSYDEVYFNRSDVAVKDGNVSLAVKGGVKMGQMGFMEANAPVSEVHAGLGLSGIVRNPDPFADSVSRGSDFFFLDKVRNAGLISSRSYSLWFGNDNTSAVDLPSVIPNIGTLMLGAVDPRLYYGNFYQYSGMSSVDIASGLNTPAGFPIVPLTRIQLLGTEGRQLNLTDDLFAEPVLLNSRFMTSYLPKGIVQQIARQTNAVFLRSINRLLVDCSLVKEQASFRFHFGDLVVEVPLRDFIGPTNFHAGDSILAPDNNETCYLKLMPSTGMGFSMIGMPILRQMYIAADTESGVVGMALAVRPCDRNVSSLPKSTGEVAAISSGTIPYATLARIPCTSSMTLSMYPKNTSARVLDGFNGTIHSGLFFGPRTGEARTKSADFISRSTSTNRSDSSPSSAKAAIHYPRFSGRTFFDVSSSTFFITALCSLFMIGFLL
ncbi:AaceriACR150Wp [[Ashbya] aceris (nom. inval.)]|nr:AaceriACR150Wp [[Ashbya] aceris (nom. inval.)]